MKIDQFSLPNGLNVFLIPRPDSPSVAVELMVRAGSKNENKNQFGLAHFLEHMAFKGTEKWPTALKLAKALDSVGAVYNAYTSKEETAYWIKVSPAYLDLALTVISQMLTVALLKQEEIDIERGVIVEEMNMYEDQPADKVADLFEEHILGNNALGRSVIGEKEMVLRLKTKDFKDYKKKWYRAGAMSLAVVGSFDKVAELKKKIKSLFDPIAAGIPEEIKVVPAAKKEEIFWQKKATQQTHFVLGFPTAPLADERIWAVSALSTILGRGMSSRLWVAIRERRGWAYYIYSSLSEYLPVSLLTFSASVKNEISLKAIDLIKEELKKAKKNITRSEVERAKRMRTGWFLISIEDTFRLADMFNRNWLFEGKIRTPRQTVKKIEKVTWSEVKKIADQYLDFPACRVAVIGPSRR